MKAVLPLVICSNPRIYTFILKLPRYRIEFVFAYTAYKESFQFHSNFTSLRELPFVYIYTNSLCIYSHCSSIYILMAIHEILARRIEYLFYYDLLCYFHIKTVTACSTFDTQFSLLFDRFFLTTRALPFSIYFIAKYSVKNTLYIAKYYYFFFIMH